MVTATLIAAGVSAATAIGSQIMAARRANEAQKRIDAQRSQNENWFNREYYGDYTRRADSQALLNHTRETVMQNVRAARAAQAVGGGTEASVANAQRIGAQTMSDTAGRIAAVGEGRRDALRRDYMAMDNALMGQQNASDMAQAEGIAKTGQAVATAVGQVGSAIGDWYDNRPAAESTAGAAGKEGNAPGWDWGNSARNGGGIDYA